MTLQGTLWPADQPEFTDIAGKPLLNNVYQHSAIVYLKLAVPPDAAPGPRTISVQASGQLCNLDSGTCLPVQQTAVVTVSVAGASLANPAWSADPAIPAGLQRAMDAGATRGIPSGVRRSHRCAGGRAI